MNENSRTWFRKVWDDTKCRFDTGDTTVIVAGSHVDDVQEQLKRVNEGNNCTYL